MLDISALKDQLHRKDLKRHHRLMLVIASLGGGPVTVKDMRGQAREAGWRVPANWNVSSILSRTGGAAISTPKGWEITAAGKSDLKDLGVSVDDSAAYKMANDLRAHLKNIPDPDTQSFALEAVECFERGLLRSAIVMSWIGALHLLYQHVLANKKSEFNREAKRVNAKHKDVSSVDEIAKCMGEADFLDRLESISVLTNSIKKELKECLDRRNSCGHPNTYKPRKNTVTHHLEVLLLNIYEPFSK